EGLWTRYEDPAPILEKLAGADPIEATTQLQQVYAEPVREDLITQRIKEIRDTGAVVAVRVSPQHTLRLAPAILAAGVDLLVIQGTIVSAEHVSGSPGNPPLNLKTFIADLDVPVIVGGCTNYQTALHLMRTGAAGVIVGVGADEWSTTGEVLGIEVPMATAIVDAAAARRDYLDETGGRYVHVIAAGGIETSGAVAKALACGADAIMLGEPLAVAAEAPAKGSWWHVAASHPKLPRGRFAGPGPEWPLGSLQQVLRGPSTTPEGYLNLFGGARRAIAKAGYSDIKEFQKVGLIVIS
ncbi:MAG TPA: GuaB3 family IMP dehydrogenase-related protein, partial [Mycobacteriales bacterium]|nr:GuaB3 family IMP dehydrogenase-related protein [Mycobacteriales bacterium]